MKQIKYLVFLFSILTVTAFAQEVRPRVIVLTDGEIDDQSSMVRFLLYANDLDIEAIIETNSVFQKQGHSREDWLEKQLDAYGKDYVNLRKHDPRYPTADELRKKCFTGDEDSSHLVVSNMAVLRQPGDEVKINPDIWQDTPGSDMIVEVLLKDDKRPVYILAWGGGNTAAKAFEKLKTKHPGEYEGAVSKAIMYNIWYQDGAGNYIEKYHPGVTMLVSYHFQGTWDYGSQQYSHQFVTDRLHNGRSYLGKLYPQKNISEGDSPSFFYTIPNGLRSFEDPAYGGWGGMFYKVEGFNKVYRDVSKGSYSAWIEYVNRDFDARLGWCESEKVEMANHRPNIRIRNGDVITVSAGEQVIIEAEITDPDPKNYDALWDKYGAIFQQQGMAKEKFIEAAKNWPDTRITWWQFEEAGSYNGHLQLQNISDKKLTFKAPFVHSPCNVHIILEVTDIGKPGLTSFRRIVVNISPK